MRKLMNVLALAVLATLVGVALAPAARAQSNWENSTFTITEPVDVGGVILEPGTYFIKVVLLSSNRNAIQVMNEDQSKVFATVLCTPHPIHSGEVMPASRYIYYPSVAGQPKALRTWFARDTSNGQDIVYPKRRALELAAASREPVMATPDDVKEAEYETTPLTVVTPDSEVLAMHEQPSPAAVPEGGPEEPLPATASPVPLFAVLGLLSLGGALGLRVLANRAS